MLNILEINDNFCDCLIRIFIFLGHIMNIIKILVPIIIILLGSIDLIKAMIAQNDDEIKKSKNKFIKRLIYGIVVFFIISIVAFLIGLAGGDTNNRCFKCVSDVNGEACDKGNIPVCREKQEIVETPEEPESTPETPSEENPKTQEVTKKCKYYHWNPVLTADKQDIITSLSNIPEIFVSDIILTGTGKGNMQRDHSISRWNTTLGTDKYLIKKDGELSPFEGKKIKTIVIPTFVKMTIFDENNNIVYEQNGPKIMYNTDINVEEEKDLISIFKNYFNSSEEILQTLLNVEWDSFLRIYYDKEDRISENFNNILKEGYTIKSECYEPPLKEIDYRVYTSGAAIRMYSWPKLYEDYSYLGDDYWNCGDYPDLNPFYSISVATTWDAIGVKANTRIIVYSDKNFQGDVVMDVTGPAFILNSYHADDGHKLATDEKIQKWISEGKLTNYDPTAKQLEINMYHAEPGAPYDYSYQHYMDNYESKYNIGRGCYWAICGSMKVICQ